jgi:hypothetical protein
VVLSYPAGKIFLPDSLQSLAELEQSNLEGVSVAFGIQHSLREMVTGWG